jgi:hypothetical protein
MLKAAQPPASPSQKTSLRKFANCYQKIINFPPEKIVDFPLVENKSIKIVTLQDSICELSHLFGTSRPRLLEGFLNRRSRGVTPQ